MSWQELMKRLYEVDPLICNSCGGQLRRAGTDVEDFVIRNVLPPAWR